MNRDEPTFARSPDRADETTDHSPSDASETQVAPGTTTCQSPLVDGTASGSTEAPPEPVRLEPAALRQGGGEAGRYTLHGELARGGMGAVLRGRDTELGRELAIKVLLDHHRERPEVLRRFVEEAQIGGQLQHPGIVPVYDLGTFADRRPFFAMKLVRGRTLTELLRERADADAELPRFLGIFEQVAQTVAYAHAKGVIHRDLKPSNVMVGAFGEVQVMDWGLAKVLRSRDAPSADAEEVVQTLRTEPGADASQAGSVLGTPAYMAPEQARGEVGRVDERADVFGLGAILCEVLTGAPPFVGPSTVEILRKAAHADTTDALARLDACGFDGELVALAKDCLAPEPEGRPRDAGAVAARMTAYLSGVQERLRTAERERAVAETRAIAERRQRRLQLGLAASVLGLLIIAGTTAAVVFRQRAARAATVARALGEATSLRDQAVAHAADPVRWQAAREALKRVEIAAGSDADLETKGRLDALAREIDAGNRAARQDRTLMARLVDIRSATADDTDGRASDAAYAAAYREAGYDFGALSPAEVGRKIKARLSGVATEVAVGLDAWASIRRGKLKDSGGARRLNEAARVADPDPWRDGLRSALDQPDRAARLAPLRELARTARFDELGPTSLVLLAEALTGADGHAEAEAVLRAAQRRYPGDVWVNYDLAMLLEERGRRDEALRYYSAARSLRPETAHELAHALETKGEVDESIAVFQDLVRLRPNSGRHMGCLGFVLLQRGRREEAARILEAAAALHREAIRLRPDDDWAQAMLGLVLFNLGKLDEAVAVYREAIRLNPKKATHHDSLGRALEAQGKLVASIASYREAVRLDPNNAIVYQNLCAPLAMSGRLAEAEAAARRAIELQGDDARSYINLGHTLKMQKKLDQAADAYREAIRLRPNYAAGYDNLGRVYWLQGNYEGALAEYRRALALAAPGSPDVQDLLAMIREAEPRVATEARLPGVLKGDERPKSASEALAFMSVCKGRGLNAAAARFGAEAFQAEPALTKDRQAQYRYDAACYAALAGCGRGKDDPPPDEPARARLRRQALDWLKADLEEWRKLSATSTLDDRRTIACVLDHWLADADLAGLRDPSALAGLPEEEAAAWRALWADADALRKKVESGGRP